MCRKFVLKFSARGTTYLLLPHPERGRYHDIDFSFARRGPQAPASCLKLANSAVGSSLVAYRGAARASRGR